MSYSTGYKAVVDESIRLPHCISKFRRYDALRSCHVFFIGVDVIVSQNLHHLLYARQSYICVSIQINCFLSLNSRIQKCNCFGARFCYRGSPQFREKISPFQGLIGYTYSFPQTYFSIVQLCQGPLFKLHLTCALRNFHRFFLFGYLQVLQLL